MGLTKTQIANLAIYNIGGQALTNIDTDTDQKAIVIRSYFDTARDEMLRSHAWNFATKRARLKTTYHQLIDGAITNSGGLVKITHASHNLVDGDRILLVDVDGITINGNWYINYVNVNNFTLDGSVYADGYVSGTGKFVKVPAYTWDFQFTPPANALRIISLENPEDNFAYESGVILANQEEILIKYVAQITDTTTWPNDFCNVFSMLLTSYIAQSIDGPAGDGVNYRKLYEQMLKPIITFTDSNEGRQKFVDLDQHSESIIARKGGLFW